MSIIRTQTSEEKKDFEDIWFNESKISETQFYEELTKREQEAMKKEIPFARRIAIDDFKDHFETEKKNSMKKRGGFVVKTDIKQFKPNWKEYTDNFKVIDSGESVDTNLSNKNPGLNVQIAWKKYQYKDYDYTVTVMEDGNKAIERAQKLRKKLESA